MSLPDHPPPKDAILARGVQHEFSRTGNIAAILRQ